jgi:hypothetical protein
MTELKQFDVIAFAAKSDKDLSGTTDEQWRRIDEWVDKQNTEHLGAVRTVVARYRDEASGYTQNRGKGLERALVDAAERGEAGSNVEIVVTETDRLARGEGVEPDDARSLDWYGVFAYEHRGVKFRAVDSEEDEAFRDKVKMATASKANSSESRKRGVKTKQGHAKRRREYKMSSGGPPPMGYDILRRPIAIAQEEMRVGHALTTKEERDPIRGKVFPHPEYRHDALWVFQWFADDHDGYREIARRLDDLDIPTPRTTSTKKGKKTIWSDFTVRQMLANPFYIGYRQEHIYPKNKPGELRPPFDPTLAGNPEQEWNVVPGSHDGIIPLDLFIRAQLRADEIRRKKHGTEGGRPTKKPFMLTGKVKCGICDEPIGPQSGHDTYECKRRNRRKKGDAKWCAQPPIRREVLEGMALRWTLQVGVSAADTVAAYQAGFSHELAVATAKLEKVKLDLADLAVTDEDMWQRYKRNNDEDDWNRWKKEKMEADESLQAQRDQLQAHVTALASAEPLENLEDVVNARLAELAQRIQQGAESNEDLEAIRTLIDRLFDEFTLYPFDAVPDGVTIYDALWDGESRRVLVATTHDAATLGVPVNIGGYDWQAVPGFGLTPQVRPVLKRQAIPFSARVAEATGEGAPQPQSRRSG